MRPLLSLVRNVLVALATVLQDLVRGLVRAPPVEWVVYELDGAVTRGPPEDHRSFALRIPGGTKVRTLVQLRRELGFLATAPGLRGIVLRLNEARCGGAILRELRELLEAFRASGRQIVVHADSLGQREYWLASVADRIWMTPRGRLELTGFAAASSAAARLLRRFGLVFQVIRAGAFKSAGELLGADRVSDSQRLQLDELVGDLHALVVADIARGRRVAPETAARWIDEGPCGAAVALERGLVDATCYADEVRERLGADSPDGPRRARIGPLAAVFATHRPPPDWRPLLDRRPVVAVVDVTGIIAQGRSRATPWTAATAGSDSLVPALTKLRRDPRVKAVVLRIDSRGGSALASDLIWRAAKLLAAKKPVVAYLEDVAASGGYYIAAAAGQIVAAPSCITGSIGVFSMRPDASKAYGKAEVDHAVVQRGAHAGAYRPDLPLSEGDRAMLQRDVLATYEEFLTVVAEGRGLPMEKVRDLAEGRVYLAPRARALGLVDTLGSLADAVESARTRAGLKPEIRILPVQPRVSGLRELWRSWRQEELFRGRPGERMRARWDGPAPLADEPLPW